MIHLASLDKLVERLSDDFDYVARSFGIPAECVHSAPPSGLPIILIQPQDGLYVQGEASLVDFVHPDDCVYLFGASNGHVKDDLPVSSKIFIPHIATWNLFASQAAAIVLYDRYVKRGGFG